MNRDGPAPALLREEDGGTYGERKEEPGTTNPRGTPLKCLTASMQIPRTPSNASLSVQARRAHIRKEIYRRGPIRRCRRSRMATPFPIPAKHILPDPYAPHIEKLSKVDGPLLARTFP